MARWRRWEGWGAGPAGAGMRSSRAFLVALLVGSVVVVGVLVNDGHYASALVITLAGVYFALRILGVLGGSR